MVAAYKSIYAQQQAWANQRRIEFDRDGYTLSLNDNLYLPLSLIAKKEFRSGKGDEMGSDGQRGKMQALHSSSALALNVFGYWRENGNVDGIARACGAPQGMTEMQFEHVCPTPLGGIPPHLDVVLLNTELRPIAIESKFTEPYHRKTKRKIKDKYITHAGLWSQLTGCEKLVRRIHEEQRGTTSFAYLDVPQLLKHILGLSTKFGTKSFELLYLWYEIQSPEADRHKQEIAEFKYCIKGEVHFRDMTYQELFGIIKKTADIDKNYISYLTERYFPYT